MSHLDSQLEEYAQQRLSPPELFNALLSSSVFVLAKSQSSGFDSILQVNNPSGLGLVPVFSNEARVGDLASESETTAKSMAFSDLLEILPNDVGILINFRSHDVEIAPNGIETLKRSGGSLGVPAGMAQLFAEDDGAASAAKPWWKFW